MRLEIIILFGLLAGCTTPKNTTDDNRLIGTYLSKKNKFEKWSVLQLEPGNQFRYEYGLGGCQDQIKGTWEYDQKMIILSLPMKYDSVAYHVPNLDQMKWELGNRALRPTKVIDNGCFTEKGVHVKINR